MRAALLALLLALPARADDAPRVVIEVQDGLVRTWSGETIRVAGGAYLPGPTLLANGQELASLRAENARLKLATPPPATSVVVALVVGMAIGLTGGATLVFLVKR